MSHNHVRYHRVAYQDGESKYGPGDKERNCTPASLSWPTLLFVWLMTTIVTALVTTAVTGRIDCNGAVVSTKPCGHASQPLHTHYLPPSQPSTAVLNPNSINASSAATRSPCRSLPVTGPTPTPPPAVYLPPAYHDAPHSIWFDLPSLTLLVRTFSVNWFEILQFHFTYSMFWPRTYTNSGLLFVLDEERASDRRLGTLLLHAWDSGDRLTIPSKISVVYEAMPGSGILSDRWRNSIGYCRQQYSNFYSDLYTDRDYVGIIDTDAYLMRPPNPEDVFERTPSGTYRPILIGFNGDTLWCASAEYMIGKPCAGEFMINFPVTIKRAHFAPMRRHIMAHLRATSFEMAWRRMLTDVGDDMKREYSQFTIMATYLWHYHHDDYAWRINSVRNKRHKRLKKLLWDAQNDTAMTSSPTYRDMATRMAQYDIPTARYVQHPFKSNSKLTDIYHSLCFSSNFLAGDCASHDVMARNRMELKARQMWYTDEEETERVWTSERYPSVESNSYAVVNNMAVYYAGQWRAYEWPAAAREAAGEAIGVGEIDELSGCSRDDGSSGKPFVYRPHRVNYNATDGTFHEPDIR